MSSNSDGEFYRLGKRCVGKGECLSPGYTANSAEPEIEPRSYCTYQVLCPLHPNTLLLGDREALGSYRPVFRGWRETWSACGHRTAVWLVVVRIRREEGSLRHPSVLGRMKPGGGNCVNEGAAKMVRKDT